jgi:hypothetical protein
MSFKDQIAEVEINDAEALTSDAPKFHWYHGIKQAKTPGHFFIKSSAAPIVPTAPWKETTNAYDDHGYMAESLKIAIIAKREVWFIPGEQGTRPEYLTHYKPGAKLNVELLCFVEGFGDEPLILSGSGKFKAGAFKNFVKQYESALLRPAIAVAEKNLHAWTFWVPVGSERDGKGHPVYEMTTAQNGQQGASVTPPIIVGDLDMDALYVGAALLKQGEAIKAAYSQWSTESRAVAYLESEVITAPKQLVAPGRNVPQFIDANGDDVPF